MAKIKDPEIREAQELLETATDEPDALSGWEQGFATDLLERINLHGDEVHLSDNRKTALREIKRKLVDQGIIEAGAYEEL